MEELPLIQKCISPAYIPSPQLASSSPAVASNVTYFMGNSAGPKHFWRNRMACRTVAKTSLVHRFTQVLLNPTSKEGKSAKDEEELASAPAFKLKSLRMKLEMDVERLHEQLQQETELHSALENAIAHAAGAFSTFPRNLPLDAQELLTDVAMLEVAVSSLEEQMMGLKMQICHERNERLHNTVYQAAPPSVQKGMVLHEHLEDAPCKTRDLTQYIPSCEGESKGSSEQVSGREISENMVKSAMHFSNCSLPCTCPPGITSLAEENIELSQSFLNSNESIDNSRQESWAVNRQADADVEVLQYPGLQQDYRNGFESRTMEDREQEGNELEKDISHSANYSGKPLADDKERRLNRATKSDSKIHRTSGSLEYESLWREPNRLSQEMVSCMIGIYCHLADPSEVASGKHMISDNVPSPSSPFGHVASSSFSSLSDLSNLSFARSPPNYELKMKEEQGLENNVDPYGTQEKVAWGDIGIYSSAFEVSWMSVGKEQLEYAADALRIFRCLVEQLSKVDATALGHQEKLAFWINVYNALMMHAYLAYGVPKNDVKYFALMQKAAYTVGGHFFNAMAIEHVLLRGKAPSYRPQIALLLALHKLKIPEGASKFAISRREPLVMFALSCGAWSSPAVMN